MKVAILTTDSREHYKDYGKREPYFATAVEALLQGFARVPEIELHVVSCLQQRVESVERIAPNIWYHALHVPKLGWLRTGYQGCIRAVRRELRLIRPDLVHGQGTERDCALSAVMSGLPNVLTIHGNMRSVARVHRARPFSYLWWVARLEQFTLRRTGGVVCITSYTQRAVQDLVRQTWVVPNPVDRAFFAVERAPMSKPRLLCVANICAHKNQNFLIGALDHLAQRTEFELVFFGHVEGHDPYGREFLRMLASRPWCRHGGFADRAGLRSQLAQSTLLVLPSLEDNCPMVVLEAAAAGVPIVAARIGGVPDLIDDGRTGLLCDPRQPADLAGKVERLLMDRGLAERLAAVAKAEARTRYHPRVIAQRHAEIYREVLSAAS